MLRDQGLFKIFFKRNNDESSTSMPSGPSPSPPICEEQPPSQPQGTEDENVRVESHQEVNTNSLEHDPRLRPQINRTSIFMY